MLPSSLNEPLFSKKSKNKFTTANIDFRSPITYIFVWMQNGSLSHLLISFLKWNNGYFLISLSPFSLNDPTISLSYEGKPSTAMSILRCVVFTVILPLVAFEVVCYKSNSDWSEINHSMFSVSTQYLCGYAFSCFISSFINSLGGSFSPDFIERCDPVENITLRVTDISECSRDPTDGLTYIVINEVVISTYSLLFLCKYLSVYFEKQNYNSSIIELIYIIILSYCYGIGMIRNNCGSLLIGFILYYIMIKNVIYFKSQFSEIKDSLRKFSSAQRSRSSDGQSLAIIAPLLSDEKTEEDEEEEEEETAL